MDSGHSPMIGILQVASVSPLEYSYRQSIISTLKIICNIKFARQTAILRVSYFMAIHPHLMSGVDTPEMQDDATTLP